MWRLGIACFAISTTMCVVNAVDLPLKPWWHQPNDFDLNGKQCSTHRPPKHTWCPIFGIRSTTDEGKLLTSDQLASQCKSLGFAECPQNTYLFPDGTCKSCPPGSLLKGGDGSDVYYCEQDGKRMYVKNPFECLQQSNVDVHPPYLPCLKNSTQQTNVIIPHFYSGLNFANQQVIAACAESASPNVKQVSTTVRLFSNEPSSQTVFSFPLLYGNREQQQKQLNFGYLQCPNPKEEQYSFLTPIWLTLYFIYGPGLLILVLFAIYKFFVELHAWDYTEPVKLRNSNVGLEETVEPSSTSIELTEANFLTELALSDDMTHHNGNHAVTSTSSQLKNDNIPKECSDLSLVTWIPSEPKVKQFGYVDSIFGTVSFYLLWGLTLGWFLVLAVIVLDFYGMHLWTLCDETAREICHASRKELPSQYFSLRRGFACAEGCLFSHRWTTGKSPTWPYFRNRQGGYQLDAVFIGAWHIAAFWCIVVKALQKHFPSFFRLRCSLRQATVVLISRPREPEIYAEKDFVVLSIMRFIDKFKRRWVDRGLVIDVCHIKQHPNSFSYFDYRNSRYCWSDTNQQFCRPKLTVDQNIKELYVLYQNGGLSEIEAERRWKILGPSEFRVDISNLFAAVGNEFFDWFYLYEIFCLWVWVAFHYWQMAIVILCAIVSSGIIKLRAKRRCQWQIKAIAEKVVYVNVLRNGQWVTILSTVLVPGDIICIEGGNGPVVCDCLLIAGNCIVDESSLTGEPSPVAKLPVSLHDDRGNLEGLTASTFSSKHWLLAGTKVESVRVPSKGPAAAVVIFTGSQTEKGQLLRGILYPLPLSFKFDQHWKIVFWLCLAWGLVVFGICIWLLHGNLAGWYYGASTISQILSPLIPAVFVWGRANSARRLEANHSIRCINIDRILVCGKVEIFCFDKTGTLTESGMDVEAVIPIDSTTNTFSSPIAATLATRSAQQLPEIIRLGMGCCHELSLDYTLSNTTAFDSASQHDQIIGSILDRRMFAAAGMRIAMDKDETIILQSPVETVRVLRRFEFERATMTMSCIVQDISTPEKIFVFCKGSFESMLRICNQSSTPNDFEHRAARLAAEGYYVLALAYKLYDNTINVNDISRIETENDLHPIALIIFSNKLKPSAIPVLQQLKQASIRPVMLTGDSAGTAIKIAQQSGLTSSDNILLGDISDKSQNIIQWKDAKTDEPIESLSMVWEDIRNGTIELAVSGKAFEYLLKQVYAQNPTINNLQNSFIEDLLVNPLDTHADISKVDDLRVLLKFIRIFARMKPEQKVQAVKLFMGIGITGMCGDGANDAGALRAAHVGLGLGNKTLIGKSNGGSSNYSNLDTSDAAMVAPFSSPGSSLISATTIVKEGRCALATSVAGYKDFMVYGELMVAVSFIMYYFGINLSEPYWITVDSLINIGMSWAIMQARPNSVLTAIRPSSKLLGTEVVSSVLLQLGMNIAFLVISIIILFQQKFFVCREFDANLVEQVDWWKKADNFEAEVLAIVSFFQLVNTAGIYNFGFDYRQSWYKNTWLVIFWAIGCFFGIFLLFTPPTFVSCLFRVNCGDQSLLSRWIEIGKLPNWPIPYTAPYGCSCQEQVSFSYTCENEYIDCRTDQWNQINHHNIMPLRFRFVLFGLVVANTVIGFFLEWFFIVGPVRRKLRAIKANTKKRHDRQLKKKEDHVESDPAKIS